MLRRVENVQLTHSPGFFTGRAHLQVTVGKDTYEVPPKLSTSEFDGMIEYSKNYVVPIVRVGERQFWLFAGRWYWDNEDLNNQQVQALLIAREQQSRARIDRAQEMLAMGQSPRQVKRGSIPNDIKQLVWMRDGGRCRACGSAVELQYDHIIPVAFGGASSEQNLQILCGPCNRRKGASLG